MYIISYEPSRLLNTPFYTKTVKSDFTIYVLLNYLSNLSMRFRHRTKITFVMVDGGTRNSIYVSNGSPEEDELALKTHLQRTLGWNIDHIVVTLCEPCKYAVRCDTVSTPFVRNCSVADATTETDNETVQKELREFLNRNQIR